MNTAAESEQLTRHDVWKWVRVGALPFQCRHRDVREAERQRQLAEPLSIPDVARAFDRDLDAKGLDLRLDLDRIEDSGLIAALNAVYPEAIPVGKAPSYFDAT